MIIPPLQTGWAKLAPDPLQSIDPVQTCRTVRRQSRVESGRNVGYVSSPIATSRLKWQGAGGVRPPIKTLMLISTIENGQISNPGYLDWVCQIAFWVRQIKIFCRMYFCNHIPTLFYAIWFGNTCPLHNAQVLIHLTGNSKCNNQIRAANKGNQMKELW